MTRDIPDASRSGDHPKLSPEEIQLRSLVQRKAELQRHLQVLGEQIRTLSNQNSPEEIDEKGRLELEYEEKIDELTDINNGIANMIAGKDTIDNIFDQPGISHSRLQKYINGEIVEAGIPVYPRPQTPPNVPHGSNPTVPQAPVTPQNQPGARTEQSPQQLPISEAVTIEDIFDQPGTSIDRLQKYLKDLILSKDIRFLENNLETPIFVTHKVEEDSKGTQEGESKPFHLEVDTNSSYIYSTNPDTGSNVLTILKEFLVRSNTPHTDQIHLYIDSIYQLYLNKSPSNSPKPPSLEQLLFAISEDLSIENPSSKLVNFLTKFSEKLSSETLGREQHAKVNGVVNEIEAIAENDEERLKIIRERLLTELQQLEKQKLESDNQDPEFLQSISHRIDTKINDLNLPTNYTEVFNRFFDQVNLLIEFKTRITIENRKAIVSYLQGEFYSSLGGQGRIQLNGRDITNLMQPDKPLHNLLSLLNYLIQKRVISQGVAQEIFSIGVNEKYFVQIRESLFEVLKLTEEQIKNSQSSLAKWGNKINTGAEHAGNILKKGWDFALGAGMGTMAGAIISFVAYPLPGYFVNKVSPAPTTDTDKITFSFPVDPSDNSSMIKTANILSSEELQKELHNLNPNLKILPPSNQGNVTQLEIRNTNGTSIRLSTEQVAAIEKVMNGAASTLSAQTRKPVVATSSGGLEKVKASTGSAMKYRENSFNDLSRNVGVTSLALLGGVLNTLRGASAKKKEKK